MGFLSTISGLFPALLRRKSKEEFDIEAIGSAQMDKWIQECIRIYRGEPSWLSERDHIDTICFAKAICSETARLATLGIGIRLDGSARAEWLQQQIDSIYFQLRTWVEYAGAYGTVILKPNGNNIRLYKYGEFDVTHCTDGNIDGAVFYDYKKEGDKWYTRLEYHRFENGVYAITNKCYVGNSPDDTKKAIDIKQTPWADLMEESKIVNVEKPLFGVLRMPHANNIDLNSPYGLPVFSEAMQELRDLDIAYSRNAKEILDSKRTILLDSDRMLPNTQKQHHGESALPDFVKLVDGNGELGSDIYHEINPQLNTATRLEGVNALLSQIGYKVGFSNGYFVFNESSGIQTATGVEAEQQRTVQFIKDVRDRLECCLDSLIYALNVFADLYGLSPRGVYEVVYDFGDITYNQDEDRARWWGYVVSGKVPAWRFFVKFEGMTEEEAKAMIQEAAPAQPKLFGNEE